MSPNWSEEEKGKLRELWQSDKKVSENLHLFQGKTIDAVGSKARRMGLGPRGKSRTPGDTWFHIKTIIAFHGPIKNWQIAKRMSLSTVTVQRHIRIHRSEVFAYEWTAGEAGNRAVPAFKLGPGREALPPRKGDRKVKMESRFRRRMENGTANVFGSLIKQIV